MNTIGVPTVTKVMVMMFRLFGLWPTEQYTILYKLYSYSLQFIFSFLYALALCVKLYFLADFKSMINALGMVITLVALNIKMLNLYNFNKKMQKCLQYIENFQLDSADEVAYANRKIRTFSILAYLLYSVGNVSAANSYVGAYFRWELPFSAWYPRLDIESSKRDYWILFCYQVCGMSMLSNFNMSMELFPSYLMYMISIKMKILGMRLQRIGAGIKNQDTFRAIDNLDQRMAVKRLVSCVKTHQNILR